MFFNFWSSRPPARARQTPALANFQDAFERRFITPILSLSVNRLNYDRFLRIVPSRLDVPRIAGSGRGFGSNPLALGAPRCHSFDARARYRLTACLAADWTTDKPRQRPCGRQPTDSSVSCYSPALTSASTACRVGSGSVGQIAISSASCASSEMESTQSASENASRLSATPCFSEEFALCSNPGWGSFFYSCFSFYSWFF